MLIEQRTESRETPTPSAEFQAMTAALEDVRCRHCRRLLAKNTRDALRPGGMLELKCHSCNTLNFLLGRPEADG